MESNPAGTPPDPLRWPAPVRDQNGFRGGRYSAPPVREKTRLRFPSLHLRIWLPVLLFLLTCLTTLAAGAMQLNISLSAVWANPALLVHGLPFSGTLLLILGAHELGHYFATRAWGIQATLPYFIPAPATLFGTFGAVIRIKSPILSRKALLDVAVAGPLAGMAVALPATLIGLSMSEIVRVGGLGGGHGLGLGSSLLFQAAGWTVLGSQGIGESIGLHPVAFAGWCGFLVTSLNLIPAGQLDGGHIVYTLLTRWHRTISIAAGVILLGLSYWWPGWLLWATVALFMGRRRRYPLWRPDESLGRGRILLGCSCMVLMLLTFTWVPIYIPW